MRSSRRTAATAPILPSGATTRAGPIRSGATARAGFIPSGASLVADPRPGDSR